MLNLLIKDRETQLFSGDLILLIVRRVFFSFRPDLITFLKAISVSQSHLSSSIVSWDEDPLERSSDAFRAGGPAEKVEFS